MERLVIRLTDDTVYASYMGGSPYISPLNDAWFGILKSLYLGGDIIEVIDERDSNVPRFTDMTFTYNTDTAEKVFPKDPKPINPLYDLDELIQWLEKNPDELERITKLINE